MDLNKSQSRYFCTAAKMDQALIDLLQQKPFEYITVSEVCKRAGVNRSTFYLHYENLCDLLEEATRKILDDFISCFSVDSVPSKEQLMHCDFDQIDFMSEKYLQPYLNYFCENKNIFLTMMSRAHSFGTEEIFNRLFCHIFDPILERFRYPVQDRKYVMRFYLNGINAVVSEWIKDGCKKSIDDMIVIIRECIFGLDR